MPGTTTRVSQSSGQSYGDTRKIVEHVGSYAVFDLCSSEPLTNPAG